MNNYGMNNGHKISPLEHQSNNCCRQESSTDAKTSESLLKHICILSVVSLKYRSQREIKDTWQTPPLSKD